MSQDDLIYFDTSISTNKQSYPHNGIDPVCVFNNIRSQVLLDNCSNYEMSVVRFSIDGPTKLLPLFIPTMDTT